MTRTIRRIGILIAGCGVILVGLVLSIPGFPGPGFVVIALGIAILATEFPSARRLLIRLKEWAKRHLPDALARRIHISEEDAKMMDEHRKKRHASASD